MQTGRLFYLDWLRVFALSALMLFHVAFVYGPKHWPVISAYYGSWMSPWLLILTPWRMSLVYIVAGSAAGIMVSKLSAMQFIRDRFFRLIVPCVFVVVFIIPPQEWLSRNQSGLAPGEPVAFWLQRAFPYPDPPNGFHFPDPLHVWFLPFLFAYSVGLALFVASAPRFWRALVDRPWSVPLNATIIVGVGALLAICAGWLEPRFPRTYAIHNDITAHVRWLPIFVLGVLVARRDEFWLWLAAHRWALTVLALGGMASMLGARAYFAQLGQLEVPQAVHIVGILRGVYGAATLFGLMGHARQRLTSGHPALTYASKAIMPVYLFHYMGIVCAMLAVDAMHLPFALEFSVLLLGAVLGPLFLYESLIKRVPFLPLLCGMKGRTD